MNVAYAQCLLGEALPSRPHHWPADADLQHRQALGA
jgi:hypothetical protein